MSADTLVRHSERSLKKPCTRCGRSGLYWGHDPERRGAFTCDRDHCKVDGEPNRGKLVLCERDGTRHTCHTASTPTPAPAYAPPTPPAPATVCGCPPGGHHRTSVSGCLAANCEQAGAHPAWCHMSGSTNANVAWREYVSGTVAPEAPTPAPTAPPGDDAAALAELLGRLTRSQVDRAEVEGWAREAIRGTEAELRTAITDLLNAVHHPTVVQVQRGDTAPVDLPGQHHNALPAILRDVAAGEHVLMVGPAGTGKSTLAHQVAVALDVPYYSISLSPQTPASALLGYQDANGRCVVSLFEQWYVGGGIFHFDEMDNGHPSILATVNAALANGHMAFPGGMRERHPNAYALGSANTYGRGADRKYVGRQALDVATTDRFTVHTVNYDLALEDALCAATGYTAWTEVTRCVRALRANADAGAMPLVFSPRASVGMCRILNAGGTWAEAVDTRLRRGLSDADWAKVTDGVRFPA